MHHIYPCPYLFLIFSEVRPTDHQGFIGFPFAQVQQYLQYLPNLQYLHLFIKSKHVHRKYGFDRKYLRRLIYCRNVLRINYPLNIRAKTP